MSINHSPLSESVPPSDGSTNQREANYLTGPSHSKLHPKKVSNPTINRNQKWNPSINVASSNETQVKTAYYTPKLSTSISPHWHNQMNLQTPSRTHARTAHRQTQTKITDTNPIEQRSALGNRYREPRNASRQNHTSRNAIEEGRGTQNRGGDSGTREASRAYHMTAHRPLPVTVCHRLGWCTVMPL